MGLRKNPLNLNRIITKYLRSLRRKVIDSEFDSHRVNRFGAGAIFCF
jgi:hypothetical protein